MSKLNKYTVTPLAHTDKARTVEADGFYVEEHSGAVCFWKGERTNLVTRLYNVNVELADK